VRSAGWKACPTTKLRDSPYCWPDAMSKRVKQMVIAEIRERIGETAELLVVDSSRLDAITTNKWRLALRQSDISVLTVKNSLAKKALSEAGVTGLDPYLEGSSTLVWGGEDIVALSREIAKWAREIKGLEIKGGTAEGTSLNAADVDALSKSPSREELIGQIAGLALSPGARLCGALLGPGGKLAGQIETIAEKADEEEE
jgi:large subunit ribosomal protein L10